MRHRKCDRTKYRRLVKKQKAKKNQRKQERHLQRLFNNMGQRPARQVTSYWRWERERLLQELHDLLARRVTEMGGHLIPARKRSIFGAYARVAREVICEH